MAFETGADCFCLALRVFRKLLNSFSSFSLNGLFTNTKSLSSIFFLFIIVKSLSAYQFQSPGKLSPYFPQN